MAVAYRSSNTVTNGTAGTSVTVSKPAGMTETGAAGADVMVAFIAATGAPSFTPPAGWTLITTIASGSDVTLAAYWKLASSEGASFTWTLGTSQRNWGSIGAYTGVDPTSPVTSTSTTSTLDSSTTLSANPTLVRPAYGMSIAGAAATRTASGAATTWTHSQLNERADLSTNAGAGTDISGVVADSITFVEITASTQPTAEASQAQTAGVQIAMTLKAYFTPYTGEVNATGLIVEAALGVDPDSDSADWTWTDLTSLVLDPSKVVLRHGRANRSSVADPSEMRFTLKNLSGEFTHPAGAYWAYMVRNLPFRVRLNGFGLASGGQGHHRGTAFLASMRPRWDASTRYAVVDIVAAGRLRRLQQRDAPLRSPAYRAVSGAGESAILVVDNPAPIAYWPFEDESDAEQAASAVDGVPAMVVSGATFGAYASLAGSQPIATLATGATITATAPPYSPTGFWGGSFVMSIPGVPGSATTVMEYLCTGSAPRWRIELDSTWHIRAYDSAGTSLLNATIGSATAGTAYYIGLWVRQNGPDVDYTFWFSNPIVLGSGTSGTLSARTVGSLTDMREVIPSTFNGAAFGHLGMVNDATFSEEQTPTAIHSLAIFTANADEVPYLRFGRLCEEQGQPHTYDASDNLDMTMGAQPTTSFVDALREAETVEGCVLNDSGVSASPGDTTLATGLLWFPARDDRENVDATLTLDVSQGQVAPGFGPILDDQDILNDAEVSRSGGSAARVTDSVSISVEGGYDEQVTVNTNTDAFLDDLAGMRVNLGTVRGMRFPSVKWNLRASPELAEEWMACRLFNRVDVLNPPSQYPPDDIAAVLEGYVETIAAETWEVEGNLSPYDPNRIFVLADPEGDTDEFLGRLTGDPHCALRTAIDSDDTAIAFDPNRRRWTTRLVWDAFGRTASSSWGNADSGQTWTNTGTAANFSVSTGAGRHSLPAVNSSRWSTITSTAADVRVVASVATDVLAAGGSQFLAVAARWADVDNTYLARLEFTTAAVVNLTIRKRVAAVETLLSSTFVTTLTHVANTAIRVMFEVSGSTLSAKAWLASSDRPEGWQATVTDTSLTAAGSVGVRSILSSANTNPLPVGVAWDDFASSEAGDDADDFPLDILLAGEVVTVSANATTAATFVAAGTAAHADNATVTPTLPAGATTGDLLLILAAIRSSGTGLVTTPTGYTRLPVFASTDNVQLFGKVHTGSESDPAVSFTAGSSGDTTSANMIALRGTPTTLTDLTDIVVESHTLLNASAANITVPGVYPSQVPGSVVLYLGWKQDDWTSAATPTGFTEAFESSSTTGSDQAIVAGYVIQTTPACAAETTVTITGGASAISRGAMVALAAGYQTFTASARSVNGTVKSHTAGTLIEVDDSGVLGM